jgi:GTP-binding protein HflX
LFQTDHKKERVVLVGTVRRGNSPAETEETLAELAFLAESAGAVVKDSYIQNLKDYDPAYFIGKGKAAQIAESIKEAGIDSVIFDDDLTPGQMKNLGKITGKKIIDRTGLILEIFAQNARTREAKTQVELAQLQYLLPRLTRQWLHLERQVGGIGVRGGMGEKQLEIDRRIVRDKIKQLKEDLNKINNQRDVQRKKRADFFKATLIGYTNAGKSTLFNALIPEESKGAFVADRLFATLDSTVRRLCLDDHLTVIIADTVGFIRKLPHDLIASFRSTIDVVRDADLLFNVADVSHPLYEEHLDAVLGVLQDLGLDSIPVVTIFNKIDLVDNETIIQKARKQYPQALFVSAVHGVGIRAVLQEMSHALMADFVVKEITVPIQDTQTTARIFNCCQVLDQKFDGTFTTLKVRLSRKNETKLNSMIAQN